MSIGTFGNIRSADININDIDMFYTYSPNRESEVLESFKLNPNEILNEIQEPTDDNVENTDTILEGLYNLRLPAETFNELGIYNIYIKPKSLKITIADCGVLSSAPSIKGVVIDGNQLDENLRGNNALQGYRIEYYNTSDGSKLRNLSRYVVTSNRVAPVTENIGNTSQKAVRYRFDDSGSLIFLQVTPSSSSRLKPNIIPFIGVEGQKIKISNTGFDPMMLEIELVENDIESIMNILARNQVKDVKNGIVTYYDSDNNIYRQYDLYEVKENLDGESLYEVKEERSNIDTTQVFDDIKI